MDVEKLLVLLEYPEIKLKIVEIVSAYSSVKTNEEQPKELLILDVESDSFESEQPQTPISNEPSEPSPLELEHQALKKDCEEMKDFIQKLQALIFGKDQQLSDNQNELQQLRTAIENAEKQIKSKQSQLQKLNDDINTLESSVTQAGKQNENNSQKLTWYRDNFAEDVLITETYQGLAETTKSSLKRIFKDNTPKGLVACGIQEKNIALLWDYAKNEAVNGNNLDMNNLVKLFELLFSRFSIAFPMYEMQNVYIGVNFDTQLHIRHHSSSNMSGAIQDVILRGYMNSKTDNVIKQSVVVV